LIGIPTGETSGLDVLDIDARNGGAAWLGEHRRELPQTRVHRTRSGGLHFFFRHEAWLRCSALGLVVSFNDNLLIGSVFTLVSIVRSFILRRAFEAIRGHERLRH
jgi:hypothetical protein